jgi:hypothetical protein
MPDDLYRAARSRAAECLRLLPEAKSEFPRLEAQQREVQDEIDRFRAGDRLGRNEVHGRAGR